MMFRYLLKVGKCTHNNQAVPVVFLVVIFVSFCEKCFEKKEYFVTDSLFWGLGKLPKSKFKKKTFTIATIAYNMKGSLKISTFIF